MHSPLAPRGSWFVTHKDNTAWFLGLSSRLHFNVMLLASVKEPTVLERGQYYLSSSITLHRALPETGLSDETWYEGCKVERRTWGSRETFWGAELSFVVTMGPDMISSSKGLSFTWVFCLVGAVQIQWTECFCFVTLSKTPEG